MNLRAVCVAAILLSSVFIGCISIAEAEQPDDVAPMLKEFLKKTHEKLKPNWNNNHYDWKLIENNSGSVDVIISFEELDFLNLDKKFQKKLEDSKKAEFTLGFNGISASLSADSIIELMELNPNIQIQPDYQVKATVNVNQTGADALWNRSDVSGWPIKGNGIVVAIIDTGIDYNHPDLGAGFGPTYRVIGGYDFVNNDANPMDDHGHGTHCAGIVGANGSIFGMAPEVQFLAYKVLSSSGSGYSSDVIEGMERACDPNDDGDTSDHADVISMSLGGPGSPEDAECLAVQAAIDIGVVVCIASGNEGPSFGSVSSPGYAENAITVGAIDSSGLLADFSSRGTTPYRYLKPEISAPGVDVYSCYLYSGYRTWSGTSMATPHVAGAVAQILQGHPNWEPWQVKSALITGIRIANESFWNYGAGALWVPNATDETLFSDTPITSYGWDFGTTYNQTIQNNGTALNYTISTDDWHCIWGNYSLNGTPTFHSDVSAVTATPAYLDLATDSIGYIEVNFAAPAEPWPEGYYEGTITLTNVSKTVSLPIGYMVMSELNVYVLRIDGGVLYDSAGEVAVFDDAATIIRSDIGDITSSAPPLSVHVPSGTYNVFSLGRALFYSFSDPYVLYGQVTVGRTEVQNKYLNMAEAKRYELNLSSESDHPIYVKEFRLFWRYQGTTNLSYHFSNGDYTIEGAEYFTLPKSHYVYISEMPHQAGIALCGYAYSDALYEFMQNNYDHWYEYISGTSTLFNIVSTTDLQYLLSWEFAGINDTLPESLSINWSRASAYSNNYNIPGTIYNPYLDWGTVRGMGASAAFFERRDTSTSVEPFMSGMNRTTIVQGPQLEWYPSMGLFEGLTKNHWFVADWNHTIDTATSGVDVPNRQYLIDYPQGNASYRTGAGPLYFAARMENTNTSMVLYQPFFADINDMWTSPYSSPSLYLYRGTSLLGIYSTIESSTNQPGARKLITLSSTGWYHVRYTNLVPNNVMSTRCDVDMGFLIPGLDVTPPRIAGFDMPRKFTATDALDVTMELDDADTVTPGLWWRNGVADTWTSVSLSDMGGKVYDGTITTLAGTTMVDVMLNISDTTGNYLNYTLRNVSRAQTLVDFNVSVFGGTPDIPYRNSEQRIVLVGYLSTGGTYLSSTGGVPIDLYCEGIKLATIIDENMTIGAHTHNGTIRFDWDVDPTKIFTASGQTKIINAKFDLGTYQTVWSNFTVNSVADTDAPPVITLYSPSNDTAMIDGAFIDFDITDEALTSADYAWDNGTVETLAFPYSISTVGFTTGYHWVRINATDANTTSTCSFRFRIDADIPVASITAPANGTSLPEYSYINASATDDSTFDLYWEVEGSLRTKDYSAPYQLSTAGWDVGWYNVTLLVYDDFGHLLVDEVNFNITALAPVLTNTPSLTGTTGVEYSYNATCTVADVGANLWALETNATWMNLNYSDETHGYINGISGAAGYFWVNLSVSDTDTFDYNNFTITIELAGSPPAPTITSTAIIGAREDHLYEYPAVSDQTIDTWVGITNATWLTFEPANATFWGTPDNSVSEWDVWANVSCTNVNGSSYQNYSIHVWNLAPAFTPDLGSPPLTGVVGREITYDANHSDEGVGTPPGNSTVYQTNFTGSYSFDEITGSLVFTPLFYGELWWNITGNDQRNVDNSTSYQNWTMTIEEKAPYIISGSVATTTVWELFFFNCTSTPADSGINTWNYESNATWLSFIWGNQTLYNVSGTPVALGSYYVNFSISDTDSDHYLNFTLSVVAGPAPVFITSPSLTAWEDHLYFYLPLCDQPIDTWNLLFNNATWATWSAVNGSFMGTPDNSNVREYYSMYISATSINGTEWQNWWMEVHNNIPIFSTSGTLTSTNGTAYSYDAATSDEGTIINATYTVLSNAPFGYSIGSGSGHLNFTPTSVGIWWFNITFDDGTLTGNASIYQNFSVTVNEKSPLFTSSPLLIIMVWTVYLAQHTCTPPDNGATDWEYTTNATWIGYLSGGDGTNYYNLSGTPTAVGNFWLNITVEDADTQSYLNFSIDVQIGPAPNFTTTPSVDAWEDHVYSYVAESDNIYVLWSHITNSSWLMFTLPSMTGIPDNSYSLEICYVNLTISNMNGTAFQNFSITVWNNPPILSGTPSPASYVGIAYSFDPDCTDESIGIPVPIYNVTTDFLFWHLINASSGLLIIIPTSDGIFWFNITFDDLSGAANATTYINFTVSFTTYLPPGTPPNPSGDQGIYPSFTYIIDGYEVFFTDTSYGDILGIYWSFGDGTGSNSTNPSHKYRFPDIYNVTLSITSSSGEIRSLTTRIAVGLDEPFGSTQEGWRLLLPSGMWLTVSALGLAGAGVSLWVSSFLFREVPIITLKGRRMLGLLCLIASAYYFVFVNNGWLG